MFFYYYEARNTSRSKEGGKLSVHFGSIATFLFSWNSTVCAGKWAGKCVCVCVSYCRCESPFASAFDLGALATRRRGTLSWAIPWLASGCVRASLGDALGDNVVLLHLTSLLLPTRRRASLPDPPTTRHRR